jgi:hypothetical protein
MSTEVEKKIREAKALSEAGRFEDSIALLKPVLGSTSDSDIRVLAAAEIVNAMLELRHRTNEIGVPEYGTQEYDELYDHLRILVLSYEDATPETQRSISLSPLKSIFKTMSSHHPTVKRIEQQLKDLESEFSSGRVTVARRGKWADDFMARFPVSQQYDFYNHDPKVVDKARELAGMGGLLILLNTDGHKNELCVLKGSKAASRESKSGCFIATAAYGSEIEPEVLWFRLFRDQVLINSAAGATFVQFYYRFAPSVASAISKVNWLRVLVRLFILEPMLQIVKAILAHYDSSAKIK